MSDIFVSYAREDIGFVGALVAALQAEGWTVWWDRLMPIGGSVDQNIESALGEARCVIVVWSKSSVYSAWVKDEAFEGKERGILIPVLLDNVTPPFGFRLINGVSFTHWTDQTSRASFRELINAVEKLVGRRAVSLPVKGTREVTPLQVVLAVAVLVFFISVVVSTSLDQAAGKGTGFRASPTETRTDPPVSDSASAKDIGSQTLQVTSSNPDAPPSEEIGNSDITTDTYAPSAEESTSALASDSLDAEPELTPVVTGQIVVVARTSRLAYRGLVFMIDERIFSYEEILDSTTVEVARLSVPAGDHLLKVNPELNEQPILFNVSADETVEIIFHKSSLSRFDWKVYIRGERVR